MNSEDDELAGERYIDAIFWYNKGGTEGDDLLIKDGGSDYIILETWFNTDVFQWYPINRMCKDGIKVITLDAGKIVVYEKQFGQQSGRP
jgi:hypothetical protein